MTSMNNSINYVGSIQFSLLLKYTKVNYRGYKKKIKNQQHIFRNRYECIKNFSQKCLVQ